MVYVIMKKGYNYDDEYFYLEESAGDPVTAHTSKEEADKICKDLNLSEFKKIDLQDYRIDNRHFEEYLVSCLSPEDKSLKTQTETLFSRHYFTDEQVENLYKLSELTFYEVVPIVLY